VLGASEVIAFVSTTDLERARAFYEGTLGLTVSDANPFACVFDAGGTMLRVTLVPAVPTVQHTVLGWRVPDLAATARALGEHGVVFERFEGMAQDENGIWTTPGGDLVVWFKDPDGNTLSLTQFAR
jgi:catechol 2,3-dioxygenase-like lactoylglutathione lyase family enzyme